MSFFKGRLSALSAEQKGESELYREVLRLGAALRVARSERGWSVRELADRAGISEADIAQIERGSLSRAVATVTLCRLGHALGLQLTLTSRDAVVESTAP